MNKQEFKNKWFIEFDEIKSCIYEALSSSPNNSVVIDDSGCLYCFCDGIVYQYSYSIFIWTRECNLSDFELEEEYTSIHKDKDGSSLMDDIKNIGKNK